ncbi:MAG: lipopolysaccharide kinase InaA family protein [Dissulfuribacterales bacterium]
MAFSRRLAAGGKGLVPPDETTFLKVLKKIALISRQLNDAGWVHMGFSVKHIFVRPRANAATAFDICLIDYEKCRKHPFPGYRTMKDCSHFMRHTPNLSDAHKRYYLKSYFQTEMFTPSQRRLIRKMRGAPKNL